MRAAVVLTALAAVAAAVALTACGSSDPPPTTGASARPVTTEIIAVLPKDASSEPPWNGRFVQVNVRTARPEAMRPADWRVYVNGRRPALEEGPSVLPYAPTEAIVAFVFSAPLGDPGACRFRVVYAPKGEKKIQRSWAYALSYRNARPMNRASAGATRAK